MKSISAAFCVYSFLILWMLHDTERLQVTGWFIFDWDSSELILHV